MNFKINKKGFTIIELIVVIAILGILVLLATPRFGGHIKDAHYAKSINNAKSLQDASQLYYMDHEDWPRLTDEPYTSEQLEEFSERIYDVTGREVELDPEGNYYDIDYEALSNYAKVPDNKKNYILQNPIGKVFYMENLTEPGSTRVEYNTGKQANQEIPSSPSISNITDTSVTIDGAEGTEVSLGDGVWHNSPHTFTDLEEGTSYTVYSRYKETDSHYASKMSEVITFSTIVIPKEPSNFAYTGSSQTFVAPTSGKYKLEVWGAQGQGASGGRGGYSTGEIQLTGGQALNIFVGGQNGYNGGGWSGFYGGGGTDIRLNGSSLSNRIIVAGGGGGQSNRASGGFGGGSTGGDGSGSAPGYGATQTSGGSSTVTNLTREGIGYQGGSAGGLGRGGTGIIIVGRAQPTGGGGGGYYGGGGGGTEQRSWGTAHAAGGGGSGYIGGVQKGNMIAGNQSMPDPNSGGTMTGNTGHGYAKITYIGN